MNNFEINQVIRIRSDQRTIGKIEKEFGIQVQNGEEKIGWSVGRVTGMDVNDPGKVFVQFDRDGIKRLIKGKSIPSGWLEEFKTTQPAFDKEVDAWIDKGSALFLKTIEFGDLRNARRLFKEDGHIVDASARNADGIMALHVACSKGHKEVVQWLLYCVKAELEEPDNRGFRAIHHSVIKCQLEVLKILIEKGAQLDALTDSKRSPLEIAISHNNEKCVEILIQSGCNINLKDSHGRTPLAQAIHFGRSPAIIQMLVTSGRINWDLKDRGGFNVLHLIVIKNNLKAMELILPHMDPDIALECMPEEARSTILHYICIHQNIKILTLLLNNFVNDSDPTNLKRLLEARNISGTTALMIAVNQKNFQLIQLLIDTGADVKALDDNGDTALILAARNLSPKGFNPPKNLLSPFLLKALEKYPALLIIGYLIEKGFDWKVANSSGLKAADYLSNKGYSNDAVKILNGLYLKMQISIRRASGGTGCMGQDDCINPPTVQLICPHKPTYKTCSKCFAKCFGVAKCGCDDEEVTSVILAAEDDHRLAINEVQVPDDPAGEAHHDNDDATLDTSEKLEAFAKRFKQERIKVGFSQRGASRALGISHTIVSQFERCLLSLKRMYELKIFLLKYLKDDAKLLKKVALEVHHEKASREKKKSSSSVDGSTLRKRKKTAGE